MPVATSPALLFSRPVRVLTLVLTLLLARAECATPGPLVVVGGGKTNPAILSETLRLGGGTQARVAILPQASELPDTGEKSASLWREAGAAEATVVDLKAADAARATLSDATLIWMPGGDQNRLVAALQQAGLVELLRDCRARGAVIGGTSAGAAVLSELMITGEADLGSVSADAVKLAPGLGLWPEVIVDQHFLKRQRFNRLLSAVLAHPEKTGVGIDEGTAVIVTNKSWRIIGASQVMLIRAGPEPEAFQLRLLKDQDSWPSDTTRSP